MNELDVYLAEWSGEPDSTAVFSGHAVLLFGRSGSGVRTAVALDIVQLNPPSTVGTASLQTGHPPCLSASTTRRRALRAKTDQH